MTEFDADTVRAFVEDSLEQLGGIADDLLTIETAGTDADPEVVNRAFRAVHSIKGGAGFMGLDRITELSHAMESILNLVRNEGLTLTSDSTSTLRDISASVRRVSPVGVEYAVLRAAHFGDGAVSALAGMETAQEFIIEGLFDDTATTGPDAVLSGVVGSASLLEPVAGALAAAPRQAALVLCLGLGLVAHVWTARRDGELPERDDDAGTLRAILSAIGCVVTTAIPNDEES